MLEGSLVGKRALVTGGSRGIGRATVLMLARAGAQIGFSYFDRHDAARALIAEIEQLGVPAWAQGGDLARPEGVDRLFERTAEEFGGLDIFVGNAGVWPSEHVPLPLMQADQWRRTLAINLDSIFYSTRAAARIMADNGRIVLISSTAGQRGEAGHADYAASKGAIISFVKSIAVELASHGITANCVAPGWVDTDMAALPFTGEGKRRIEATIPLRRIAAPDDVAGPIVFLCSPLARHITGEVLNVNGGSVLCG
ncbi:MAG TPA: SDR family oxidoreductase [Longimicrobiales bacterium]|nr:SDR family oxidoreductase [Longimicrobiales bacterium]